MGFGSVFAAVVISLTIFFVLGSVTLTIANYWMTIDETKEKCLESLLERSLTSIKISSIQPDVVNNAVSTIYIEVLNDGKTSIDVVDFSKMDIILEYTSNVTDERRILWLPYKQSGETDGWMVEDVYTRFNTSEVINPINIVNSSGQWDPDEILKIKIQLSSTNLVRAKNGDSILVLVSTPNAVKSTRLYVFP
ncbi:hypothetical protein DRO30_05380 [Candidatus Bathyarchaeota archaeon]|nr:MAG: hypothetical protein DRO30_05380 [Candidatus Bathyarchaeota archaeon]